MSTIAISVILIINYFPVNVLNFMDATYYAPKKEEITKVYIPWANELSHALKVHNYSRRNDCDNAANIYDAFVDIYHTSVSDNPEQATLFGKMCYYPQGRITPHVINFSITDEKELIFIDKGNIIELSETEIASVYDAEL